MNSARHVLACSGGACVRGGGGCSSASMRLVRLVPSCSRCFGRLPGTCRFWRKTLGVAGLASRERLHGVAACSAFTGHHGLASLLLKCGGAVLHEETSTEHHAVTFEQRTGKAITRALHPATPAGRGGRARRVGAGPCCGGLCAPLLPRTSAPPTCLLGAPSEGRGVRVRGPQAGVVPIVLVRCSATV